MKQLPPVEKNDDIDITIDALGSDGQGIGRLDGYAIFVPFALVGEHVRAHVIKVTSGYAIAKLIAVIEASPERVEPDCAAYPRCGGCTLRHLSYTAQLAAKRMQVQDALVRLGKFQNVDVMPVIGMPDPSRYRNKGSFPFGYDDLHNIAAGFFAQRSHRIVPLEDCPMQDERIMQAVRTVRDWAREFAISPYDEEKNCGILRHVIARASTKGVLVAVVTAGKLPHASELTEHLRARVSGITGILHNVNPGRTNVIFGQSFTTLWGSDRLETDIGGHSFKVSMASFLQVNPKQTEALYNCAMDALQLDGSESVADIYCGIGTISLMLAERAKRVIGIECVSEAIDDAKCSARDNGISNAEFICGNAEDVLPKLVAGGLRLDAAVIDPPRKGCEAAVLDALAQSGVQKILYVSCNPATLARDLRALADRGYNLELAQPVDMFPYTHHVECVVELCLKNIDNVLTFQHFTDVQTFTENGKNGKNKELKHSIGVTIASNVECGNMTDE